jgi:hypothetical protein
MFKIFADASNILKLRLCLSIMCNILVVAIGIPELMQVITDNCNLIDGKVM